MTKIFCLAFKRISFICQSDFLFGEKIEFAIFLAMDEEDIFIDDEEFSGLSDFDDSEDSEASSSTSGTSEDDFLSKPEYKTMAYYIRGMSKYSEGSFFLNFTYHFNFRNETYSKPYQRSAHSF
jgi:phage repressor protein C with HTH and peptisase S24 domain